MNKNSATQIYVIANVGDKLRILSNAYWDFWMDVEDKTPVPYGTLSGVLYHCSAYDDKGNCFLDSVKAKRNEMLEALK